MTGERSERGPSGPSRARWLRRIAFGVAGIGATTLLLHVVNGPADPSLAPAGAAASVPAAGDRCGGAGAGSRRPLDGFGSVTFRVTGAGGPVFDGCALLAETPEARAQGLMDQSDLRGYDGMVFRFDRATEGGFHMFRTGLPLSIAFVAPGGDVVSTADMEPCLEQVASACPSFTAAAPYLHAIEVGRGDLVDLGIEPGGAVTFGDRPAS